MFWKQSGIVLTNKKQVAELFPMDIDVEFLKLKLPANG